VGDPLVAFATATAGLGLWVLLTGRPIRDWPRWPLTGRSLRLAGAFCLFGSLIVVVLAETQNAGFAFLTYAILALALLATSQLVRISATRI
jgi:hypothetical protein